jgi:hypothetical protein
MPKSRRDFIAGTAAVGLLGVSEASAQSAKEKQARTTATPRSNIGTRTPKIPNVTKVQVVSVIPFMGTTFEAQFKAGLNNNGAYLPPIEKQGYSVDALKKVIQAANDGTTLVVTAGGLIAAQAAFLTNTPFVGLVGGVHGISDTASENFLGGITMEIYSHHDQRLLHLKTKVPCDPTKEVCLLYNSNSGMWVNEVGQFPHSQPVSIDQNTSDA